MLEVRGYGPVGCHNRPSVVEHGRLCGPEIKHRFDRHRHPGLESQPFPGCAVVGDVRRFVHLPADAVADVLTHHTESERFGGRLDGVSDVAKSVPAPELAHPVPQRLLGDIEQTLHLVGHITDRHGECRVTVPALVDRSGIDRDDVAVAEGVAVGDSVDDRRVRRCADRGGEPVITQERRPAAAFPDHLSGDRIEIPRRNAGARRISNRLVHRGDSLAGDLHLGEVFRLLLRCDLRSHHQDASSVTSRQKMSSIDPTPSTRRIRSP